MYSPILVSAIPIERRLDCVFIRKYYHGTSYGETRSAI